MILMKGAGAAGPVVDFPMGRDWEDQRLLTTQTFPPITTLNPRDPTTYPNYSYLRVNQWDGQYQPNTTMGARWSPAYRQFAGMGEVYPRRYRGRLLTTYKTPLDWLRDIFKPKKPTMRGMGATGVPGAPYPKSSYSPRGNRFTRIVGDRQFPLFRQAKKYQLAGMGQGGSILDTVTGGKLSEIDKGLDQATLALKVSTAASILTALVVLAKK